MTQTQISVAGDYPSIIVHAFETDQGTARPLKRPKENVLESLPTRRPHKKSRYGCARCKTRRIKCDELKPSCGKCLRRRMPCVYPDLPPSTESDSSKSREISPLAFPSFTSDTFTMQDMRFFHHFLIKATPQHPVGNDEVWAREIPQFAQQNQYLMHSMLAMAASHLSRLVDDDSLEVHALTYRIRGIDGLRKAMQRKSWGYGDHDSMLAGTYALMIQSVQLTDGMFEWLRFLRMATFLGSTVRERDIFTEFDLRPNKHYETIQPYLHLLPSIDSDMLALSLAALEAIQADIADDDAKLFCDALVGVIKGHQTSPSNGYLCFGLAFKFWLDLGVERFERCINAQHGEMQLLMAYFGCMLLMMLPLGLVENRKGIEWSSPRHLRGMLGWIRNACENVPPSLHQHLGFPKQVIATAIAECEGLPFSGPPVLQLRVAVDFATRLQKMDLNGK